MMAHYVLRKGTAPWFVSRKDFAEGELAEVLTSRIKVIDGVMWEHWNTVQERDRVRRLRASKRYDQDVLERRYAIGDLVLMRNEF